MPIDVTCEPPAAAMRDRTARRHGAAGGPHTRGGLRWIQWLLDPWSDERTIAALRLLMAGVALVVTFWLGLEPDMDPSLYAALGLYGAYSSGVYVAIRYGFLTRVPGAHWIDVASYTVLTALGGGTTSPFFSFYYFAILIASFRGGQRDGVRVTLASAFLFTAVSYVVHMPNDTLSRFILRPAFLITIGCMMARLGNVERQLKRRLVLLREVAALANPRFGEGQTIGSVLDRLRVFHDADIVLFIVTDDSRGRISVRRTDRDSPEAGVVETEISADRARILTSIPLGQAVILHANGARTMQLNVGGGRGAGEAMVAAAPRLCAEYVEIAAALDCRSFISVPVRYDASAEARVYVGSKRPSAFAESELAFLAVVFEQVMPAIERLRLLDKLALHGAAVERQRLSSDLHDSVIQPYVGLQIGIAAALQQARSSGDPIPTLERLLHVTEREIASLRQYGQGLQQPRRVRGALIESVRQLAADLADTADIRVEVTAPAGLVVDDRVAAEVLQILAEGFSNIRRHTRAAAAVIQLDRGEDQLVLRIENEGAPGEVFRPFVPRSINGRVRALGGSVRVFGRPDGGAAVEAAIPL